MVEKIDFWRRLSFSFLICCFLEEYVRLDNEVVVYKICYEEVYVGVYGLKDVVCLI